MDVRKKPPRGLAEPPPLRQAQDKRNDRRAFLRRTYVAPVIIALGQPFHTLGSPPPPPGAASFFDPRSEPRQ